MLVTKAIGDTLVFEFAGASDKAVMFYCSYALDSLGFTLDVRYTNYAVGSRMILNHVCDITGLGGRSELPPGTNECSSEALRAHTGACGCISWVEGPVPDLAIEAMLDSNIKKELEAGAHAFSRI